MDPRADEENINLNPKRFPRRIDLELSDASYQKLIELSSQTGRSVGEIALSLIDSFLNKENL
ncbi:MAG: hypothetical protein EBU30_00520 [Synechococcaceae bacterium WB6_3B_236]|nr:hypothetical protein [Synechococcaceae bacterium WB6_3B_236]